MFTLNSFSRTVLSHQSKDNQIVSVLKFQITELSHKHFFSNCHSYRVNSIKTSLTNSATKPPQLRLTSRLSPEWYENWRRSLSDQAGGTWLVSQPYPSIINRSDSAARELTKPYRPWQHGHRQRRTSSLEYLAGLSMVITTRVAQNRTQHRVSSRLGFLRVLHPRFASLHTPFTFSLVFLRVEAGEWSLGERARFLR